MREIVLKKLRIRILEYYDTQRSFAEALGMSQNLLSYRLQGRTQFRSDEIYKVCQMLDIPQEQISRLVNIFLTLRRKKSRRKTNSWSSPFFLC